jgi:hypothetical protein
MHDQKTAHLRPSFGLEIKIFLSERSFLDFAVANARRAYFNALSSALDNGMNTLQVQIPPSLGDIVGVADATPELRPTATDFTNFCHKNTPPLSFTRVESTTVAGSVSGTQQNG